MILKVKIYKKYSSNIKKYFDILFKLLNVKHYEYLSSLQVVFFKGNFSDDQLKKIINNKEYYFVKAFSYGDLDSRLISSQYSKSDAIYTFNSMFNIKKDNEEHLFNIIAGPCTLESYEVDYKIIRHLVSKGINIIRCGLHKPRTSPYSFQGLGSNGYDLVRSLKSEFKFKVCSEVLDIRDIEPMLDFVDIFQVGTRNIQNFSLLKELGKIDKPVILKRGYMSTIDEFLSSAEYLFSYGNENIILCERGVRCFDSKIRNILDISAISILKEKSCLPVIVDPSHAAGRSSLVSSLSYASVAAGADGLIIEVHSNPKLSIVDSNQAIDFNQLDSMLCNINSIFKSIK